MFLYLVRHGEAKPEEEDILRGLSGRGLEDIRKVASFLEKKGIMITQILHSAKTRAAQTAQVLAEHLRPPEGISGSDGLASLDDPQVWLERISHLNGDIMLVGHLPHLARLASLILGSDIDKETEFKTGGVVCLKRLADNRWSMEWVVTPEVIA